MHTYKEAPLDDIFPLQPSPPGGVPQSSQESMAWEDHRLQITENFQDPF